VKLPYLLAMAAVPLLAAVGVVATLHTATPTPKAPAAAATTLTPPINGITCDAVDHRPAAMTVHLSILINGRARDLLPNIGMSNALVAYTPGGAIVSKADCYYWLHTGRDDGVINADPPAGAAHTFTLGDFFDIWHQPLGTHAVASDEGPVISYLNGKRYDGNPRAIPLSNHAVIQLDVGADTAPSPYTFLAGE
jgi:hypothetical protein